MMMVLPIIMISVGVISGTLAQTFPDLRILTIGDEFRVGSLVQLICNTTVNSTSYNNPYATKSTLEILRFNGRIQMASFSRNLYGSINITHDFLLGLDDVRAGNVSFMCQHFIIRNGSSKGTLSNKVYITAVKTYQTECQNDVQCYGEEQCLEMPYNLTEVCPSNNNNNNNNNSSNNTDAETEEDKMCSCAHPHIYTEEKMTCSAISEAEFGEQCNATIDCTTWLAVCYKTDDNQRQCVCPKDMEYDNNTDSCSGIEMCPGDKSYIYYKDANVCHKLVSVSETYLASNGTEDFQCTSVHNSSRQLDNDDDNILKHIQDTMWTYGIYGSIEEECWSYTTTVILSANHSNRGSALSTWFWPNGQPISQDPLGNLDSLSYEEDDMYLQLFYDGMNSKLKTYKNVDINSTKVVCILDLPDKFCKEDTDEFGNYWNFTEGDTTRDIPCPDGYTGIVTRECTPDGTYKVPFYNCTLEIVTNIKEQLTNGTIAAPEALAEISKLTANLSNDGLYIGDILGIVDILELSTEQLENTTGNISNTIEDFLNVASFLLDHEENGKQWQSRIENENKGSESLLFTVDNYIELLSIAPDQLSNKTIVKENLAVQIGLLSPSGKETVLEFPPASFNGEPTLFNYTTSLFLTLDTDSNDTVRAFTIVLYNNIRKTLPVTFEKSDGKINDKSDSTNNFINSQIISIQLIPEKHSLTTPLDITFEVTDKNTDDSVEPFCVFWNYNALNGSGAWSDNGCRRTSRNQSHVQCQCDHLTNFAILMAPTSYVPEHEEILKIVSIVGCGISIFFLLVTVVLNITFWSHIKTDSAILTTCLCVALLLAYALFIGGVTRVENKAACTSISALLHYLFLLVFFLMLAEGVSMLLMIARPLHRETKVRQLVGAAFALPAVIVGVSLGITRLNGYGSNNYCWLSIKNDVRWAFIGPVCAIILINFIIMAFIMKKMFGTKAIKNKKGTEKLKTGLWMVGVLIPVMGCTWIFGVFSVTEDTADFFQILFAVANSLQGFIIFIFHCALNKKLRLAIKVTNERQTNREKLHVELQARLKDRIKQRFSSALRKVSNKSGSTKTDTSEEETTSSCTMQDTL